MSRPLQRTALRDAERRLTSPSSQSTVVAVTGPTPYWPHQRLTADLAACQAGELTLQRHQRTLELVNDRQGDLDPRQGRGRQTEHAKQRAPVGPQQLAGHIDDAVVKQRRQ